MNLVKLLVKDYSENITKIVMLFLISTLITVVGLFWFAQFSYISGSLNVFEYYGLEDKVLIYSDNYQNELSEEELDYLYSGEIKSVGTIERCQYSTQYNAIYRENYSNWTHLYIIPELKENPYRMIAGSVPVNENEIMISSNIPNLKCGDTYDFYYDKKRADVIWEDYITGIDPELIGNMNSSEFVEAYTKYSQDLYEVKKVSVTVVGVFDINSPFPLHGELAFPDYDNSLYGNSTRNDGSPRDMGYAFFSSIVDEDGSNIQSLFNGDILITPKEGYSTKDVIAELNQKIGTVEAYDYEKYRTKIEVDRAEDIELFRSISISLIVVLITMNVSYCLINLAINKQKLAIYYIAGLPWKNVVILNSFMYIVFVISGYILGLLIYKNPYKIAKEFSYGSYMFVPKDAISVGLILLVSYALVNMLFYLFTSRKNPIDLVRRT